MSKELTVMLQNADVSIYKEDLKENQTLSGGMFDSVPMVKTVGKEFVIVVAGDPMHKSAEITTILLNGNENKSNKYYKGKFDPKETLAPDCSSIDDIKPDYFIEVPQSKLCANCPHHYMGGPCRQHRKMAVLFLNKDDTYNIYGLDIPAKTLAVLHAYGKHLEFHKIPMSAVFTKITMDESETYAKFDFESIGLVPIEIYRTIVAKAKLDPVVQLILKGTAYKKASEAEEIETKKEPEKKSPKKSSALDNVDFEKELDAAIAENLE
jgi:hypothetical protein